jgi:hypothetical protein
VNTGSGGGGTTGSAGVYNYGVGGSGVVIFAIPSSRSASFSGGVTQTSATVGANKVYTVTAAGVLDTVTFS